jgi:pyrimidine deaminase RibD-like protein
MTVPYASSSWMTKRSCAKPCEPRLVRATTTTCPWAACWSPEVRCLALGRIDATAHAEIVALRVAAQLRGRWRMDDVTAYVTLEPCVMCAGALLNARVSRLVIGASDEKAGAVGSRYNVLSDPRLLHEVSVTYDILAVESAELLRAFFLERRPE